MITFGRAVKDNLLIDDYANLQERNIEYTMRVESENVIEVYFSCNGLGVSKSSRMLGAASQFGIEKALANWMKEHAIDWDFKTHEMGRAVTVINHLLDKYEDSQRV